MGGHGPFGGNIDASSSHLHSSGSQDLATQTAQLLQQLRSSVHRLELEFPAVRILGPQSFGLGVAVGIGGQIIDMAIDLASLVKTLVLADLYDQLHARSGWQSLTMLTNPVSLGLRALAASGLFEEEMRAAHRNVRR